MPAQVEEAGIYGGTVGRWGIPCVKVSEAALGFNDSSKSVPARFQNPRELFTNGDSTDA